MGRTAILGLLLAALPAVPASAVSVDDLLAHGYSVAAATRLAGLWTGCVRQHRLSFADGSVFACARTQAQTGYEPRVTVLRRGGDPPSVVMVGSTVLSGELLRFKLHDYAVPLRMDGNPLPASASATPGALSPTGSIPSLNTVTEQLNGPLPQGSVSRRGSALTARR